MNLTVNLIMLSSGSSLSSRVESAGHVLSLPLHMLRIDTKEVDREIEIKMEKQN